MVVTQRQLLAALMGKFPLKIALAPQQYTEPAQQLDLLASYIPKVNLQSRTRSMPALLMDG